MAEESEVNPEVDSDHLTIKDGEALSLVAVQVLSLVSEQMKRVDEQKSRIDAIEQLVAQLMMGYSEMAVLTQGLAAKAMADMGEEDAKAFLDLLDTLRNDMRKVIHDAARGEDGSYSGFASAISRLGGFRRSTDADQPPSDPSAPADPAA